jgi:hypothetical protein
MRVIFPALAMILALPALAEDLAGLPDRMQGEWLSVEDPGARFVVSGDRRTDFRDDTVEVLYEIRFADSCPDGGPDLGPVMVAEAVFPPRAYMPCFFIISLTDTELRMTMMSGTDATLTYRRR